MDQGQACRIDQHGQRHCHPDRQCDWRELYVSGDGRLGRPHVSSTSASSTPRPGCSPTIRASPRPRSCDSGITYIDGDQGVRCCTAATRSRSWPNSSDFMEVCYLLLYGDLPKCRGEGQVRADHHLSHHGPRAADELLSRLSAATPIRWRSWSAWSARCLRFLSRQHRHQRPAPAGDRLAPADRQDADDRRDGLQVLDRPALHLSAQRLQLRCQFPAHDVFGVPAEEYVVNPVLERAMDKIFILHADHEQNASTSTVRLAGSSGANPFRLHCGRHRLALGTGPWRRQRGGPQDAGGDRQQGPGRGFRQEGQGPRRSVPADGLRPPCLQELRPARHGHAKQTCYEVLAELGVDRTSRCWSSPWSWSASRWRTSTSSRRNCIPNVDFYSGHHPQGDGLPDQHVHGAVRTGQDGRLGGHSGRR